MRYMTEAITKIPESAKEEIKLKLYANYDMICI